MAAVSGIAMWASTIWDNRESPQEEKLSLVSPVPGVWAIRAEDVDPDGRRRFGYLGEWSTRESALTALTQRLAPNAY